MGQNSFGTSGEKLVDGSIIEGDLKFYYKGFADLNNGKLIDQKLAKDLVKRHWEDMTSEKKSKENVAVVFNRRILSLLLSQDRCEGIRFYFAKTEGNIVYNKLVLVGVDKNDNDLGAVYNSNDPVGMYKSIILDEDSTHAGMEDTIIAEVGGGNLLINLKTYG